MSRQGLLIAIEGIDGSGKSTLAQRLSDYLTEKGYTILLTKEPGSTPLGKQIRTLVQHKPVAICPKAEYLLFAADRAQHAHEVIIPALQSGSVIISDRMGDSSIVYQGYARGLDIAMIKTVNEWALNKQLPHVTVFVALDPAVARKRYMERNTTLSSFEQEHESFIYKLHEGFQDLYKNRKDVILIDGNQDKNIMLDQTVKSLIPWFTLYEIRPHSSGTVMDRQP